MKYFTKEWFADTILAGMCFQVRKSSKASKFSEKYYLSLYKEQKKWFVKNEKFIAKHNKEKFDLAAAEAAFEANYNENLEYVKANLPESILSRVADVRVLALGSAESDIVDDITRFCGQVNARCERLTDDYKEELATLGESVGWAKLNTATNLLNSAIEKCECDGNNFVFATSAEYTEVACRVDLIDAKVKVCDEGLVGSAVAAFELLPAENGEIIFSALCQKLDGTLIEFSATAKGIEVI